MLLIKLNLNIKIFTDLDPKNNILIKEWDKIKSKYKKDDFTFKVRDKENCN